MNVRRNPILELEAGRRLEELPLEARVALRDVLLELADQANRSAERAWHQRKGPMAVYWRAVSTYAKHIARATLRAEDRPATEIDPIRLAILRMTGVDETTARSIARRPATPPETPWSESELRLADGNR